MVTSPTPPPRFDMLGPPSWGERFANWFMQYVFVDLEWARMVLVSFVPTFLSLVAQIMIHHDVTLPIVVLNAAWIRWSATLTLLSATWLLTSSMAAQVQNDLKRDCVLYLFALWGLTLAVSLGIDVVLAGPEKDLAFKYWFVCGFSGALLLADFALCVGIRKMIFTRVLSI